MIIGQRPSTGARRLCTRLECQGRQRTDVRTCTGTNGQTEATRTYCDGLLHRPALFPSLSLILLPFLSSSPLPPLSAFLLLLVHSSGTLQAIAIHRHVSSLIFQARCSASSLPLLLFSSSLLSLVSFLALPDPFAPCIFLFSFFSYSSFLPSPFSSYFSPSLLTFFPSFLLFASFHFAPLVPLLREDKERKREIIFNKANNARAREI